MTQMAWSTYESLVNKTGRPHSYSDSSYPPLTCWYSWQTSGCTRVSTTCWRCGFRSGLEPPPRTAARTMRGVQGWEGELGVVTCSSISFRKTGGGTKVPISLAAARHCQWAQTGKETEKNRRHQEGEEEEVLFLIYHTSKILTIHYCKQVHPKSLNTAWPNLK